MATSQNIYTAEAEIKEALGADRLLDNIERALDTDTLENVLAYIARMEDIKLSVELEES